MEQDIIKRIETLEARVAELEKALAGGANVADNAAGKLGMKTEYNANFVIFRRNEKGEREFCMPVLRNLANSYYTQEKVYETNILDNRYATPYRNDWKIYDYTEYFLHVAVLTDGSIKNMFWLGDTLREVKLVADLAGYSYDKKIKKEKLAAELINKYGINGAAIVSNHLVTFSGEVYRLEDARNAVMDVARALQSSEFAREYIIDKPFEFDDSWGDVELVEAIYDYIQGLKRRYHDDGNKELERFKALWKELKSSKEN